MIQTRERRLLYVDDTEEQRYAMRRILENAGYTVLEAGTGAEALRMLAPEIEAVVLDVKLPDMSGYDVCRRIKTDPATASIPVLQVSASFADPALRASGLSGGADAYVAQPVHPAELLSLVAALIRSRGAEKVLRFQAEVSSRLTASLDYRETIRTVETAFLPSFADRCHLVLAELAYGPAGELAEVTPMGSHDSDGLDAAARDLALEVARTGVARLSAGSSGRFAGLTVPLRVGRKRLGALVFHLAGANRFYTTGDLALAEDLADRAALALQNAHLFSGQRAAQDALIRSEKLAAAGRLSAAIAHEINNPLESITNLLYLIDTSDDVGPASRAYVQEALSELSRLTHIARQSLGFYRELTGPVRFNLNDSVEDTLGIYLKRFEQKQIAIERDYAREPLELTAVKGELRQVISNLLVNVYDVLGPGGTLTVSTARRDERTVLLRVSDNGPGIPPAILAHIFEPFFTTKQGTGTGLGLWVSDEIVTKHGGSIEVQSRWSGDDRGTAFTVLLPASPA